MIMIAIIVMLFIMDNFQILAIGTTRIMMALLIMTMLLIMVVLLIMMVMLIMTGYYERLGVKSAE